MLLEQLNTGACKTYLLASETTHDAMLVDPVLEHVPRYQAELARRGLTLRYVLDTHVHADHVSGAALLRERTGAKYVMHRSAIAPCVDVRVDHRDTLELGEVTLHFLHTPGHTTDSVTLRAGDVLLTGDFLFIGEGGAGRTDLPGGDAGDHWDALRRLDGLPDRLRVYPGHDYHGLHASNLGAERARNPRLAPISREAYVRELEGQHLGPAEWMLGVVAANQACATTAAGLELPKTMPSCEVGGTRGERPAAAVRRVSVAELSRELGGSQPPLLLDVREPHEFNDALGHVTGARLFPLSSLAGQVGALGARRVVTVCRSGNRSATGAALLAAAGLDDVRTLDGGMIAWNAAGLPVERLRPGSDSPGMGSPHAESAM